MVKPSFFILGAPKCGTTSLYTYLRAHPLIYMPRLKEPHYFADDYDRHREIRSLDEYMTLFPKTQKHYRAIGEASVHYIHSETAINNIYQFDPDAKMIAMFRNPVELVYSYHAQMLLGTRENEPDFERAWRLQEARQQGRNLPPNAHEPKLLRYAHIGKIGTQAQHLLSVFPADQVRIILFEDLIASPRQVYEDVLAFLDVPPDGRDSFPQVNMNKKTRFQFLQNLMQKPEPRFLLSMRRALRLHGLGLKRRIVYLNTKVEARPPLPTAFKTELTDFFREEVDLLASLLNRDLSHWTKVHATV